MKGLLEKRLHEGFDELLRQVGGQDTIRRAIAPAADAIDVAKRIYGARPNCKRVVIGHEVVPKYKIVCEDEAMPMPEQTPPHSEEEAF